MGEDRGIRRKQGQAKIWHVQVRKVVRVETEFGAWDRKSGGDALSLLIR